MLTDQVFENLKNYEFSFTKNRPYKPNSSYADSKAAADHVVRIFNMTYGLKTTNFSKNYVPYQYPKKLIPLSLVNILQSKVIPIYGDGQ
ncbi:GDP-mannose 4,6-dehydratase [Candidatus Coxiella mudrowiae]|uniref:GDP-mannose 4,6-dehydratase n=1 Tax=Candidatus Coxiella mudrowiae TaxID=2054173 RepID=UPI000C28F21C